MPAVTSRPPALVPLLALVALSLGGGPAVAGTYQVAPGDDLEAAIAALAPGDELILADGTYALDGGPFVIRTAGTAEAPIVIRAADGARPHLRRATADQNIVDVDAEHTVLRGLELSGGSAGVRLLRARFLTIEGCEIHHTGDVALRANDVGAIYEGLRILRNEIHHTDATGEGMYLGCNDGGCPVFDSLIEGNHVHHTDGPGVEQGDGIELKEGSHGNVIRDNVIHDTRYPCILTYGALGNGAANVVERNVMWRCGDHGIQSAADATIRNNIVLGAAGDGVAMQPHQGAAPAGLDVVHNTILVAGGAAISLRGAVGAVRIANNALYSEAGVALKVAGSDGTALTIGGNAGVGGVDGDGAPFATGALATDLVDAHHDGAPPIDVFPREGGGLIGGGIADAVPVDDFNGTPRRGAADVGAYAFAAGGNPGWTIEDDFKGPVDEPMGDGGDGGDDDADGGPDGGGGGARGTGGCATGEGGGGALVLVALVALATAGARRRRRGPPTAPAAR